MSDGLVINYDDEIKKLDFLLNDTPLCSCSVDKFNEQYAIMSPQLSMAMMTPAVRWISPNLRQLIIECPPQYRMINYTRIEKDKFVKRGLNTASEFTFQIPLPWMIYIVDLGSNFGIEGIRGYLANQALTFGAAPHYSDVPLHNWYAGGALCRPFYEEQLDVAPSLLSIAQQVDQEVWQSGFNMDLYTTIHNYWNHWNDRGPLGSKDSESEGHCGDEECTSCESAKPDQALPEKMLFDFFPPEVQQRIRKVGVNGYVEMYNAWSQVSMEDILQTDWGHQHSLDGLVVWRPADTTEEWASMMARILTAAQNAAMLE